MAERIALSPYPRQGGFDPYPVVTVEARDEGDQVVVYSEKPLTARSRIRVVESLAKGATKGAP